MIVRRWLMTAPVALLLCVGCGSSREVDIKGQVGSSTSAPLEGGITVQIFDVAQSGKPSLVQSIAMGKLAPFDTKISIEGDEVLIRAINDRDANSACTAGEAWAEARATVKDDNTVDAVILDIKVADCPAE